MMGLRYGAVLLYSFGVQLKLTMITIFRSTRES